jgi:hypothetical protein
MSDDDALRGVWRRLYLAVIISVSIDDSKAFRGWIWLCEHIEWLAGTEKARHASLRLLDLNKALLLSPEAGTFRCRFNYRFSCAQHRSSYVPAISALHLGIRTAADTRASSRTTPLGMWALFSKRSHKYSTKKFHTPMTQAFGLCLSTPSHLKIVSTYAAVKNS